MGRVKWLECIDCPESSGVCLCVRVRARARACMCVHVFVLLGILDFCEDSAWGLGTAVSGLCSPSCVLYAESPAQP